MKIETISLTLIAESFEDIARTICENHEGKEEPSPELLTRAMQQLFDVLEKNGSEHDNRPESEEIDVLGEYGLSLLQEMAAIAADIGLHSAADAMEDLSFPFAIWLARQDAEINRLEPVVNALARQSHRESSPAALKQLFKLVNELLESINPAISQDLDQTDPMRPWRILVINRAMIATRAHDPELMKAAFDLLVDAIPEDAAGFFEDGIERMHTINYPEAVKQIMQHYYMLHAASRTLH